MLGEAVQVGRRVVGPGEFGMGIAVDSYGKSLLGLGRYDEAEAPLLEAWEIFVPILGDHRGSRGVAGSLADVYRKKGNRTEAARWAARADSGD